MPLYEYACPGCGERAEEMRRVSDRARAPACPACGGATALAMSAPGRVGVGSGVPRSLPQVSGGGCGPGGCGVNFA
jgi:putative FmdB family regulatory protein